MDVPVRACGLADGTSTVDDHLRLNQVHALMFVVVWQTRRDEMDFSSISAACAIAPTSPVDAPIKFHSYNVPIIILLDVTTLNVNIRNVEIIFCAILIIQRLTESSDGIYYFYHARRKYWPKQPFVLRCYVLVCTLVVCRWFHQKPCRNGGCGYFDQIWFYAHQTWRW